MYRTNIASYDREIISVSSFNRSGAALEAPGKCNNMYILVNISCILLKLELIVVESKR